MGYYTVTKLAEALGKVSRAWISQQVKRGVIKGERLRQNVFIISEREAMKWIKAYKLKGYRAFPRKKREIVRK